MEHILKHTHTELERTHSLVDNYKLSGFKERFFSLIQKNFPKTLGDYAEKKEALLMEYSSLHADIEKISQDSGAKTVNVTDIGESISALTQDIEVCWHLLEKLISHSKRQEEIIHHEKVFFVALLESFYADLQSWIASYEKEIFWENLSLNGSHKENPLTRGKKLLLLQKQRLENYLKTLS